jgi:hypothetical protein
MLYQRGKAYSQDLRERVFAASDDGERVGEIAELLRRRSPSSLVGSQSRLPAARLTPSTRSA